MADRTMVELLRAPIEANPFHGLENENPHAHINSFKRITSTLRFRNVPNDVIKLMMFPYSLEGAAKTWYEKEPPNSILTWDDLVTKFVNQFFPPSKTTHLKNKISRFSQEFDESFSEAWERFKGMLRSCPHHGFSELTQVDTFYNGLTENEQDSLNAAAGGNLLIEIVSKKVVVPPAPVKAVEENCVTYGGAHAWYNCPATDNNQNVCATTGTYNQQAPPNRVSNQMSPPGFAPVQNQGQNRNYNNQGQGNNFNRGNNFQNQGFQGQVNHASNFQNQGFQNQPFQVSNNQVNDFSNDFSNYKKSNDQTIRNLQYQITSMKGELKNEIQNTIKNQQTALMSQNNAFQNTLQNNLQNMLSSFFQAQASPSGTLPMERETEEITDEEQNNFQGSTAQIPPPVIPKPIPKPEIPKTLPKSTPIPEPEILKTVPKANIPYPSRRDNQKNREKASYQKEKIFQMFQDLRFDISFADALFLMPRFAPTIRDLLMNKEKLLELVKIPLNENCSAMLLKKLPEKLGDPGKFLIPCEFLGMEICYALADLELADRSITYPKGLAEDVYVKVGKFHFPADFVVVDFEADPRVLFILGRSFLKTGRTLIDVYEGEITLRVDNEAVTFNLDQTMKYSSTNDKSVNRIDIIDEICEEYVLELLGFPSDDFSSGNPTLNLRPRLL
ncbi:reverse transcriptase domain-containing protein [Tanacetum coccineum]|uniref:Reverse transcriptase domain-containing protein n=1 Tax=Tanacetum coccineum TaxID=301880 RepID=A0ABQ5EM17_9ASTR